MYKMIDMKTYGFCSDKFKRLLVNGCCMMVFLLTFASGCTHSLRVKNISDYDASVLSPLEKPVSLGVIVRNNTNGKPAENLCVETVNYLQSRNVRAIYPYSAGGANTVDVVAEITVDAKYSGSGWNFLINFPGFLVWAPAWNGYVYKNDYNFSCRLLNPSDNSVIDQWNVPVHLDIRHADIGRTWTEISWFEFGVIAFIGGICFIQYDDDVTPMVVDKTRATLGKYLSSQIVQRLQNAKFERGVSASVGSAKAADALKELKELKDSGIINEQEYNSRRDKYLQQL